MASTRLSCRRASSAFSTTQSRVAWVIRPNSMSLILSIPFEGTLLSSMAMSTNPGIGSQT